MESQSPSSSCKQCTENQSNIYITCDCARNQPPTHGPLTSEGIKGEKGAITDSAKSQSTESKSYRTAKTVIYDIVRIYESTPPRTMKYLALISSLILFFAVLSLVLAQRDEAAQSKYGMAFPIDESSASANKADGRVAASLTIAATVSGVPGESSGLPNAEESSRETSTVLPSTTITSVGEENSTKSTDSDSDSSDSSSSLSGNDDEEKGETGDRNPRIVFIERLMGLHLSAPLRSAPGSEGNPLFSALNANDSDKDSSESSGSPLSSSSLVSSSVNGSSTASAPKENEKDKETKNSLDKVNAKWASRMRKFTIPISSGSSFSNSDSDSSDPINPLSEVGPNPMLRYAAAAMMSRLIAAAARAQMEAQAREAMTNTLIVRAEGKDKDEESDDETVPVIVATMRDERLVGPGRLPLPQAPPMYGRPMPTGRASSLIRQHMGPQQENSLPSFAAHHAHHHVHQHPLASARSLPGGLPAMSQRTFISSPPPQGPTSASQILSSVHRSPLGPMVIQRRGGNDRNTSPSGKESGNNQNVQPVLVMLAVPVNSGENGRSPIPEQSSSSSNYPGYHSSPYARSHVGPFYPSVPYSVPYMRPSYSPAPQAAYAVPVHVPVPVSYGPPPPPPSAAYYPAQRPIYHYPVQQRSMSTAYSHPRPVIEVPVDVPYHVPVQVPVTMRSMAAHPHHVVAPPPHPHPHPHHGPGFAYQHQPALVHPMSPSDQDPSGSDQDHIVLLYDAEIHHGEGGPGSAGDDMDNSASDGPKSNGPTFIISRPPSGPSPSSSPMVTPNKMKLWREIIAAKQAAASSQQQGVRFIPITVASPEDQQSPSSPSSHSSPSSQPSPSASQISSVHHQPSPSHSYPHHFVAQPNGPREQTSETIPQPAFIVLADQEEH
ncbi:atrophin-1-like isoform X2 [Panonychus citri]|uniref:atrophin-1-like isoform X2 n=1 Tax=Panonychus citri TaxID=50023 RepID=UPI0023080F35|nr:atrophin-1-like isoform X2 [Panonychus citri]